MCSCFGASVNTILRAAQEQGLIRVQAVGAALDAGTNCGSYRAKIAALLTAISAKDAAE
ncbi:MAG: (2Fe-2S)-binding protein [Celeribacter marinus]